MMLKRTFFLACLLALAIAPGLAGAQTYPSKPVRWIVPFQPGGTTDIIARLVGQKLSELWGQTVVIENRPGASALIGTQAGAKAAADGYTLTFAYNGNMTMNPNLIRKLPYDPVQDFSHVSMIVSSPFVLVVNPKVPAQSLQELIALAKASPGKLNFAVGGGAGNLSGELFKAMAGVDMLSIAYKGNAPSLNAVLAGEASVMFETVTAALPHVKTGKLRALGVTTAKRSTLLPDVPAIAEVVPGYSVNLWFGASVPAGTPKEIVDQLNADISRVARTPELKEKFASLGLEPLGGTPEQITAAIKTEIDTWARVVRDAKIPVE
ncbi:MAG: tripartite tricarboxylate transporter substrate binding protein [Rubrivivax sp.]|jgi:tripartite-type tricarboxylate transporter receptor subunit TctC|nr:tripartite tricarboxylate transporter substrate binding protein [Rubrivivax sp.]MDP3221837.1 tripartite tricarboxylate transporter substrate binding protein [Rubrivivax sp.]